VVNKILLVIAIVLLGLLVWQTRYSYISVGEVGAPYRINNLNGKTCGITGVSSWKSIGQVECVK